MSISSVSGTKSDSNRLKLAGAFLRTFDGELPHYVLATDANSVC